MGLPEIKKIKRQLRCMLTNDEKIQYGRELGEATAAVKQLEDDKATIVSEFKAKITAQGAMVESLSNAVRCGYVFREVECYVLLDRPTIGKKQIVRSDIDEVIETQDMTDSEKQYVLDLIADNEAGE